RGNTQDWKFRPSPNRPPFVIEEEIGLAATRPNAGNLDWPADAPTELVFDILGPVRRAPLAGIQHGVMQELTQVAVEFVCARLRDRHDNSRSRCAISRLVGCSQYA